MIVFTYLFRKLQWSILEWKSKEFIFNQVSSGQISIRDGMELMEMQRKLTLLARLVM